METTTEFIIIVGGPETGKTLNQEALMRHFGCSECWNFAMPKPYKYAAWREGMKNTKAKRVMLHSWDAEVKDPRKRGPGGRPPLIGQYVTIEQCRELLGAEWVEPVPGWRPATAPVVSTASQGRVLTCVYCGHEYPQETPASGHEVLTEHIKVCEKHPMRQLSRTWRRRTSNSGISKDAVSHTLRAICDDVQKFWLMGGRFSGSFSKLAEAHAALHGLDVETVYQNFKPHDMLAYETYCDEREYNERLLTHCREKGIKVDFEPED